MKRKIVTSLFLALGIILVCMAVILSIFATSEKDIIGGADFHTFVFVFFREYSGIYFLLALLGVISMVVSAVTRILNKKIKGQGGFI